MSTYLSDYEFTLMQKYIMDKCGIYISRDKAYLIESRLENLIVQSRMKNFEDFYYQLHQPKFEKLLSEQVIDAITTQETQWFRDKELWRLFEEVLLPAYIKEFREGTRSVVKIWSAACSTGQEPYSIAMCIDHYLTSHAIEDITLSDFEIVATDISTKAVHFAQEGKYDNHSMSRGLESKFRFGYFIQGKTDWHVNESIKKAIRFHKFNLKNSFELLGQFDMIFCRYVTLYFHEDLKREVIRKMANILNAGGVLFLGNTELFFVNKQLFELVEAKDVKYYKVKR
jgi:chemotaxis protein methyltransferase CheR